MSWTLVEKVGVLQWFVIIRYSRRVLEYLLRYLPNTRVANYSDSTALALIHINHFMQTTIGEVTV